MLGVVSTLSGEFVAEWLDFGFQVGVVGDALGDAAADDAAEDATQQTADEENSECATSSADGASGDAPQSEAQAGGDAHASTDGGGDEQPEAGRSSCEEDEPHSFVGSTRVLMADGTTKSIDQVKVGDEIADAVPGQSGTRDNTVTAVTGAVKLSV